MPSAARPVYSQMYSVFGNMASAMVLALIRQKGGSFYRFTVTIRLGRVSVRMRVRFSFSDRVGVGVPDMK